MQQVIDLLSYSDLERQLQAHPSLAPGTLQFVKRLPARHSQLLEYRFVAAGCSSPLVVKLQSPRDDVDQIATEFQNLKDIKRRLGPFLSQTVPEPFLMSPELRLLVMNKACGTPMTAVLKKYANSLTGLVCISRVRAAAEQVGGWLRSFQQATRAEPIAYDSYGYISELRKWLNVCTTKGLNESIAEQILNRASRQSAPYNGILLPAAARHGDFLPQNVLVERGHIAVVDFEGLCERAVVYEDLGSFLAYLTLLGSNTFYSRRALRIASEHVLSGYGQPVDRALLNLYTLKGAVRIFADGPTRKRSCIPFTGIEMLSHRLTELAAGRTETRALPV